MEPPIWKGTLTRGGRVAEPFDAEIHRRSDGTIFILETGPELPRAVYPDEVNGQAWLDALVAAVESRP